MALTGIEWCRARDGTPGFTYSPWIGCSRVSPACDHCWAAGAAVKMGVEWDKPPRPVAESTLRAPFAWDRRARREGRRPRVFMASMSDILDKNAFHLWRDRAFKTVEETPNLDWLILTKRPQLAQRYMPPRWLDISAHGRWPKNAHFGFTAENQTEFDRRWAHARLIPSPLIWISVEPMLGPIDMRDALATGLIGWVIVGGESGALANIRPMSLDWVRDLRDQCLAAGVPFFMKQLDQLTYRAAFKKFDQFPADLQVRQHPEILA